MLAGLSSRRYGHRLEPAGQAVAAQSASTSKSAVSGQFAAATETALEQLARELAKTNPGATASLREGTPETLTIVRLRVPPTSPGRSARPTRSSP